MADATTCLSASARPETRLQVSLVETRRVDGRVRHEHVASFGSVEVPPSVEDRIAFWQRLHERLAKLSNRLDATAQAKVLGDIHGRIPMVTPEEQRALQLRNAEADERFWTQLHDLHAGTVEGQKGLAVSAERKVAEGQAAMATAASYRDAAKERRERLQRGEDVPGGLGKPFTREDATRILREAGWSARDIQHCINLNTLAGRMDWEAIMQELNAVTRRAEKRAERAAARTMLRRHAATSSDIP
jgi:hypothetical protein